MATISPCRLSVVLWKIPARKIPKQEIEEKLFS
jgi:hypothetical protein